MGVSVECRAKKLPYIASMGIYVLKASAIRKLLYEHFPEVSFKPEHVLS
jgi:ADP-glucose pyrophosphorylase